MGRNSLSRLTTPEQGCLSPVNQDLYETNQVVQVFATPSPLKGCTTMWDEWIYVDGKMWSWCPRILYPFKEREE